jgi:ABC-type transporter Mla subunit MlaD
MRFLPLAAAAAIGLTVLTTGCSSVDKAQACIEANKVITETGAKLSALADDPKAMEQALNDAASKLEDAADTAGNTTLNDALQKLADNFKKLNVDNPDDAAKAAQKVATDTAQAVKTIAQECT